MGQPKSTVQLLLALNWLRPQYEPSSAINSWVTWESYFNSESYIWKVGKVIPPTLKECYIIKWGKKYTHTRVAADTPQIPAIILTANSSMFISKKLPAGNYESLFKKLFGTTRTVTASQWITRGRQVRKGPGCKALQVETSGKSSHRQKENTGVCLRSNKTLHMATEIWISRNFVRVMKYYSCFFPNCSKIVNHS